MNPYDPENNNMNDVHYVGNITEIDFGDSEIDLNCFDGDTGEALNTPEKLYRHAHHQIEILGNFLVAEHSESIVGEGACGTAVDLIKLQDQKIKSLNHQLNLMAQAMVEAPPKRKIKFRRVPKCTELSPVSKVNKINLINKRKPSTPADNYDRAMGIIE